PLAARTESMYDAFNKAGARTTEFDPTTSPLFERVGFVVGAPRSGTTWLQQLLFTHPLISTAGESHLFCEVLGPVFENFRLPRAIAHLGTWVSEGELLSISRAFADSVFLKQLQGARPEATFVLEKTPNHRMQSELQAKLYPDGRYVHIIRDGRDATASQRRNWAGARATKEFNDPGEMAAAWAAEIRDIRTHFGSLAYIELRYEDVVSDTPSALAQIFEHFGLPHDRALCEAGASFGKAPVNTYPDSSHVGIRKHKGDALAERSVARAAGDLLTELGYADAAEVARLRRLRTPETLAADARAVPARELRRAVAKGNDLWDRWRTRAERRERVATRAVSTAFSNAVEANDTAALAAVLSADIKLNGASLPVADAAAEVARTLGGSHSALGAVSGGLTLITFVSPAGERVVVRVKPKDGLVSEIEFV
ncbi:MAG: hypothetical protein QOG90_307, partial [Actinomycetota bacterium]